jgi:hypothetical protein
MTQTGVPPVIKDVLDFLFALEFFENELYRAVLGTSSAASQNTAFATMRGQVASILGALSTFQQIQKQEEAHVSVLLANGATNVFNLTANSFDFTGNRSATGGGPFAPVMTSLAFMLELAQGVEDAGVRAYKGQLPNLMPNPGILETVLRLHSVEGRHASRLRRIRRLSEGAPTSVRLSGTIRGGDFAAAGATDLGPDPVTVTAFFNRTYGAGATSPSEANISQAGIVVSTMPDALFGPEAAQEAFDEPLDRADVAAILQPFFIPTIN